MVVGYTSAIGSHVGMIRTNNQDSAYAGKNLFLVADGMGGHAGGDVASALLTRDIAQIDDTEYSDPRQAGRALRERLLAANKMLSTTVTKQPELAGMGTTFCGFFTVGNQLSTAHIGDSRLYRLRDGKLQQITKDHTFVQRLVDSGRITEEEAAVHPRRSVLMRVLGDVDSSPDVDLKVLDTRPGDLWLLCSDGLCGYVDESAIEAVLVRRTDLQHAVNDLIDITLSRGAPDNVTVVLVQVEDEATEAEAIPRFVGSAAKESPEIASPETQPISRVPKISWSRKAQPVAETQFEPRVDEYLAELINETKRQARNRRLLMLAALLLTISAVAGLTFVGYQWTQTRYYVGTDGETVIIYQGVRTQIGSFKLSSVAEPTMIPLDSLTPYQRRQIERTLDASSLDEARDIVVRLGGDES